MLRVALKLLVYLSILTSTRTFSSYLEPQSLVNFRRSAAGANPLFLTAQQQQQQPPPPQQIYDADTYEWQPMTEKVEVESSAYFMPRLVNTNNMLYTQLSNNNRRAGSKKTRKNKKSGDKQVYESHIKRKNSLSVNVDEGGDEGVPSLKHQTSSASSTVKDIVSHSNNNETILSSNHTKKNEYAAGKIDTQHERELQELFGVEGARKYQEYQLKQQMLNQQFDKQPVETKDVPTKKRDSSPGAPEEMQDVPSALNNQMMARTTRRQREYDVPLIRELNPHLHSFILINYPPPITKTTQSA